MSDARGLPEDVSRTVRSWLHEDRHEDADRVLGVVLDELDATPQRRATWWLAWRELLMDNNIVRIGLVAAAVVIIAVIGIQLIGGAGLGGPSATETLEPTATPEPTPRPTAGGLPLGPFVLADGTTVGSEVPITVTIGAADWYGEVGGTYILKDNKTGPPGGAGVIVFGGDLYVYGDPCQWSGTEPDSPATTADELVAALADQASRDASEPVDITLEGYSGKSITLHVPDDAAFSSAGNFTDCDQDFFGSWTASINGAPGPNPWRFHQGPGQIDEIWALDVDGVLAVIDWSYFAGSTTEDLAELQAIVESAIFP